MNDCNRRQPTNTTEMVQTAVTDTDLVVSDSDLRRMKYEEALLWAANDRGDFDLHKLMRVSEVKGYAPGWFRRLWWRTLEEALHEFRQFKQEQRSG